MGHSGASGDATRALMPMPPPAAGAAGRRPRDRRGRDRRDRFGGAGGRDRALDAPITRRATSSGTCARLGRSSGVAAAARRIETRSAEQGRAPARADAGHGVDLARDARAAPQPAMVVELETVSPSRTRWS